MSQLDTPRQSSVPSHHILRPSQTLSTPRALNVTSALTAAQSTWKKIFNNTTDTHHHLAPIRSTALNKQNSTENIPWGDVLCEKQPETTRIYVVNLNGLQLDARGGKFDTVCRVLKEVQADVFCGQEHNVDVTQAPLRTILFDTAHQHWERHRLAIGTTPIQFKTPFKPGGTMIMSIGSITGRLKKQLRDKWGRWAIHEYVGKNGRQLAIISAYQPIVKGGPPGKITVAAQQISLLLQTKTKVTNPRTAFRSDLTNVVLGYKTSQYDILLTGDFNEEFGADPDGMAKLATTCQLVDIMSSRNSSKPPATYARGTKRLDYALASTHVQESLIRSGYEPFNSRISTDHRGFYMDFSTHNLFGSETQKLADRSRRKLSTSNHKQVTAYIRRKHDLLTKCNAFERIQRINLEGNRHGYAERLDSDILMASLSAEKSLPHFDEPAWSKELDQARRIVSLLTKLLSSLKTKIDHRAILESASKTLPSDFELPQTLVECSRALRTAKQHVKDLVEHSCERRDDELKRKLRELDESTATADKAKAQQLRRIKKAEDLKNLFRKLKYVRTTVERKGVTRVEIPSDPEVDPKKCTSWIQVDVPSEILTLLQKRNRHHFGQAQGTPFTIPPLSTQLGFNGNSTYGAQILDGTYDSRDLDSNVKLLIQYMQRVANIDVHSSRPTIDAEEFRGKLRVWSESTTTSPSGLHLGHYKTLIARHSFSSLLPDDDLTPEFVIQRNELNSKQQDLFDIHLHMLNYALKRGYAYDRWKTIANTILFKDHDNMRLHRTRVIHIYEADFNLALGVKWRTAMQQAEEAGALNDGQYGSRSNRSATDPVLIEELQCEISRATRKPVVLTNYDATACYDRIIPNLGMLVSQKFGVHPKVTESNADTLEQAEYRVRTELGLAPTGYRHDSSFPIYGTGQGSANSPAIWCFLSSTLFDCYDQVVTPATYSSPTDDTHVSLGMVGFVDDCNGQTNSFASDGSRDTARMLVDKTRQNAQAWNDLLSASGGALELSKCSCHILQWQFTSQGVPILTPTHDYLQSQLTVKENHSADASHSLQLLSAYDAHKTLGHFKAPASGLEQFRQLKKKSDEVTSFLWSTPLTRLESWTFYYACYLPSVGYPLACSSLTRKQLDDVQRKAMSIMVARCGYNRNTKKEILYGPLELGGANFRSLYVQQGVGQAITFLKHWRLRSTAGKLLRIAVAWFQQQAGVSFSLLHDVTTPLPHLESKWIGSLRQFLSDIGLKLQLDNQSIPALQRKYDVHIMDVVLQSNLYKPAEIRRLNYCRMYLKAVTLSDITMVNGTTMDPAQWNGHQSIIGSHTAGQTIYQERPSDDTWNLWRRMCKTLLCYDNGMLREPLTDWILPVSQQRQQHQAYLEMRHLCQSDYVLWIRHQDQYLKCEQIDPGIFRETDEETTTWNTLPPEAVPVHASHNKDPNLWSTIVNLPPVGSAPRQPTATFDQYLCLLPEWEYELLKFLEIPTDVFSVSHVLENRTLRAVSDGSVWSDNYGSFGWTLSDEDGTRLVQAMGPASGAKVDSYRAEAYGMLSLLCFLRHLAAYTHQPVPWIGVLATDSQSLLETLTMAPTSEVPALYSCRKPVHYLDVLCPEWDLVSMILQELLHWPSIRLKHVRGHQDRDADYDTLPLLAQLNVDADHMANKYQCEFGASHPLVQLTQTAGVHLIAPHGTITSHYATSIRHQATRPGLYKYLQDRNGWTDYTIGTINWTAHGSCLRHQIKRKTHFTKYVHGILPTGRIVHRNDQVRNKCPLCKTEVEDWNHILKCSHPSRESWRLSMLEQLQTKSKTWKTRPALQRVLHDAIKGWLQSADLIGFLLPTAPYPIELHRLINQQNLIGWHHILLGRFTNEWATLQDNFFIRINEEERRKKHKRTGQKWQTTMISWLWDQWWELWISRNKDVHGADTAARAKAATREVHRTLRELYDLKNRVETPLKSLFFPTLQEHLDQPTWVNQNWISIHSALIRDNVKQVTTRAKAGMRSIRSYFGAKG